MPEEVIKLSSTPERSPRTEGGDKQGERLPERPASFEHALPSEQAQRPYPATERKITSNTSSGNVAAHAQVSLTDIERVLSADLEEMYFEMPPDVQASFKKKGEETARAVHALLQKTRVNVKKIAKLIINWLKLIPGVNKFFLEQESKIKIDEVLKLKN